MSAHHDKIFVLNFITVIGALFAFTLFIIAIARIIHVSEGMQPEQVARIGERIAPIGSVNTDPNASLTVATGNAEPRSGETVVNTVCGGCHMTGVLGAAKIGDKAAWSAKAAAGMDALVASVVNGKGQMPPNGGDPALTADEAKAAIQFMLEKSGL